MDIYAMPSVLITTPGYLLRYDLTTREVYVLEDGRPEYYGISWFPGGNQIYLSHSGLDNAGLADIRDYATSEVGWLSRGAEDSWPFLSQPHQILCLDGEMIAVTNTGRNCLTMVNSADWSIRHHRFDSRLWDRLGVGDESGSHFNSITADAEFLYILAHNFSKGSYTLRLERPSLRVVDVTEHHATGLHNIWRRDDRMIIACDSMRGALINLLDDRTLWHAHDPRAITRGLAATTECVYVGASANDNRAARSLSETGIWVVDAEHFTTLDYHSLGRFGCVHEIRLVDETDLCHPNGPLPRSLYCGTPATRFFAQRKLATIAARIETEKQWDILLGSFICADDLICFSEDQALCLAVRRNSHVTGFVISGLLDVSGRHAQHCALIGRHSGPSDTNMVAAILARDPSGAASLALWREDGAGWACLGARPIRGLSATVELSGEGDRFVVHCEGMEPIVAICSGVPSAGALGVRAIGGTASAIRCATLR